MNKHHFIIFFLALSFSMNCLFSQTPLEIGTENEKQESVWKGFKRYDFKFNNQDARIIIPGEALPGNPWIWRARFPDWHTEADSILVSEGYHLAFINTDNKFGSPDAIDIWTCFYEFLIEEYALNPKVALMGVSRGGLFIYNWAKRNPDKVASIYAEAPVCDFKSWPGGFGEGDGSSADWTRLKEEYGFSSDEAALKYSNNPVDGLELLAEYKVPVLHMIGLQDKIVPVQENTMVLINKYIAVGGVATIVPCTEGEQALHGHHFSIETPRIVADFIKYHSLQDMPLSPSVYHQLRDGLLNSQIQFERNKSGRVAFLGGSITYNSGWRDSIYAYLETRFPETEFEFVPAGIPSMGTTPAAFRLDRDVLSAGRIDLLFEEAAVNDAGNNRTTIEQIRGMEGIVRHLRKSNPAIDIVMMHFVDPQKMDDYNRMIEPEVIVNHNLVADHYNISTINLAREVTDRINNEEFTWEEDFKNLHPSPFGQSVYANSMIHFLNHAFIDQLDMDHQQTAHELPERIDQYSYDNGYLLDVSAAKLSRGWSIDPAWNPADGSNTRQNYVDVPMLIGENPGGTLELAFEGSTVGIAVAAGQDAGNIEYRIDRNEWKQLNLFTRWSSHLHLPWYYTLATGLSESEHKLEIRIAELKDERSTGRACRIRYFYVNKFL